MVQRLNLWDKKTGKWIKFKLWPIQREWLLALHQHLRLLGLKKRQVGWSQLTGADSLIQCMAMENFTTLALSMSADDAKVLLSRIRGMYQQIPGPEKFIELQKLGVVDEHDEQLVAMKQINKVIKGADAGDEMVFTNGSSLVSLSAQKGRGRTADRVILDEMAFYTLRHAKVNLSDVMKSIAPTIERAEGQLVGITTANGRGEHYDLWMDAINKKNNFKTFFVSCWDDPDFTKQKRLDIVADYGLDHANQEYPRTYKEAFLASGRPRFDTIALDYYQENRKLEPIFRGDLLEDADEIVENSKGNFKVIKKLNLTGQYAIVADVSEGLQKGDYSVAKIFNRYNWEQTAEWHGHIEHALFGTILAKLGRMFNNALIIPEANNHGHSAITQLRNVELYPDELIFEHNIVISPSPDEDFRDPNRRMGWRTTPKTRPLVINSLAKALIKKLVPHLLLEDIDELFSFVIHANGKAEAEDKCFDDRCFIAGTMVLTDIGQVEIECLKVGDMVMTRNGYRPIIATNNHVDDVISRLGLTGTADHPIITTKGLVELTNLSASDTLYKWNESKRTIEKQSYSKARSIIATRTLLGNILYGIIGNMIRLVRPRHFIAIYGLRTMVKFLKVILSIIKMKIRLIMILQILSVFVTKNIQNYMAKTSGFKRYGTKTVKGKQKGLLKLLKNGEKTIQKKLKNFTEAMEKRMQKELLQRSENGKRTTRTKLSNKLKKTQNTFLQKNQESLFARFVKNILKPGHGLRNIVRENVATFCMQEDGEQSKRVYNIQVAETPEYFANNILVHNCMVLAIAYYLFQNDTFQAFYPWVKRKKHELCRICQSFRRKDRDDKHGKCLVTQRECKDQSWCILYEEWEPDDDIELFMDQRYNKYMGLR